MKEKFPKNFFIALMGRYSREYDRLSAKHVETRINQILEPKYARIVLERYRDHLTYQGIIDKEGFNFQPENCRQKLVKARRKLKLPQYTRLILRTDAEIEEEKRQAAEKWAEVPASTSELLPTDVKIDALEFTSRTYHSLRRGGCETIQDIIDFINSRGIEDLSALRGLGEKSFQEVISKITPYMAS